MLKHLLTVSGSFSYQGTDGFNWPVRDPIILLVTHEAPPAKVKSFLGVFNFHDLAPEEALAVGTYLVLDRPIATDYRDRSIAVVNPDEEPTIDDLKSLILEVSRH